MKENDLRLLMEVGGICYKTDFLLFIGHKKEDRQHATNYATTTYRRMLKKKYIELISKEKYSTPHDLVRITFEGQAYVAAKDGLPFTESTTRFPKESRAYSSGSVIENLKNAHTQIIMYCAGAHVFPRSKPSLYFLYSSLAPDITPEPDTKYKDDSSPNDLKEFLQEGIYYSKNEVRKFVTKTNESGLETIHTTNFDGIYINDNKLLVIFTQPVGKTKPIIVERTSCRLLKEALLPLAKISTFTRNVSQFGEREIYSFGYASKDKDLHLEPHALIISNGPALITSGVIGKKGGHVKAGSLEDGYDRKVSARHLAETQGKSSAEKFTTCLRADLNPDRRLFQRIFVITTNYEGLLELSYLLHTSLEDWFKQAQNYFIDTNPFSSYDDISKIKNLLAPGLDLSNHNAQSIYMPAVELNILRYLHEHQENFYSIVAPGHLVDVLNKSIRNNKVKYYNLKSIADFEPDVIETINYSKSGFPTGQEKLILMLEEKGLYYSEHQYRALPSLFDLSFNSFWQKVEEDKISFKEITSTLVPNLRTPRTPLKDKKRGKRFVFEITEKETLRKLQRLCSMKGKVPSEILKPIKSMIITYINDEYSKEHPDEDEYDLY